MSTDAENRHRLFFCLWPDAPVRERLAAIARQHGGRRPVRDDNLHLTLVFLGSCDTAQRNCYLQAACNLDAAAFDLHLDYLGGWARPGIQWLGCSAVPQALIELHGALAAVSAECGFEPEKRRFVPHITLSRKVRRPRHQAGIEGVHWRVGDFALAESVHGREGVRYRVLERWSLRSTA